jgi:hypothetical protein
MQHVFGDHIRRIVEAYVDDIVVKTRKAENLVLTVKIRQPSHGFTFGVGISFITYPFVLTPGV